MSSASNTLENELLDHVLGEGARNFTPSTTLHLALFSGTASDVLAALEAGDNTATVGNWGYYEINTGGYTRKPVNFAEASGGSASTSADVTFNPASADYDNTAGSGATVTCIAIVDASTNGDVYFFGQLDNAKEILNGDTFQVSTGALTVSLA